MSLHDCNAISMSITSSIPELMHAALFVIHFLQDSAMLKESMDSSADDTL